MMSKLLTTEEGLPDDRSGCESGRQVTFFVPVE
jgi:hypothetical protein